MIGTWSNDPAADHVTRIFHNQVIESKETKKSKSDKELAVAKKPEKLGKAAASSKKDSSPFDPFFDEIECGLHLGANISPLVPDDDPSQAFPMGQSVLESKSQDDDALSHFVEQMGNGRRGQDVEPTLPLV